MNKKFKTQEEIDEILLWVLTQREKIKVRNLIKDSKKKKKKKTKE